MARIALVEPGPADHQVAIIFAEIQKAFVAAPICSKPTSDFHYCWKPTGTRSNWCCGENPIGCRSRLKVQVDFEKQSGSLYQIFNSSLFSH